MAASRRWYPVFAAMFSDHRAGVDGAAASERVHRRVHDPPGHVRERLRGRVRVRERLALRALCRLGHRARRGLSSYGCISVSCSARSTTRTTRSSKTSRWREQATLIPLVVLCIWIGVYPKPFLDPLRVPVRDIMERIEGTRNAAAPAEEVVIEVATVQENPRKTRTS